ncbi:M15 family metallopeptidase [Niveibacterium sp. 24ML]|uniref:M15 family metallopeptidase n=1 Tax=Niveibacterium sp. 24ML TaxID=2985512 RepID=UPI002271E8CB|nr:M15 family metallopeptidase [Niveibacterium sp. 24ML]MCX9155011.1 M15 family metallopeptidase [Niveibacterium sp. 24ML]
MELFLVLFVILLLAAFAGGLLCFPLLREAAVRGVLRQAAALGDLNRSAIRGGDAALARAGAGGLSAGRRLLNWIAGNRLWMAFGAVGVLVPVTLAIVLSATRPMAGFEERADVTDPVLAALLDGEHLVPPPALPPEVFVTAELKVERPEIATASRDWALLDAEFKQRLLVLFQQMRERGYELALLEGYRSPERQSELASMGPHVTRAGAFQSYHQFGLAADVAFYRDGKIVISERDPWAMEGYRQLGERAEMLGLTWGGRWKLMDFGHVELRRAGTLGRK